MIIQVLAALKAAAASAVLALGAHVTRSTTMSVPANSGTRVDWDTEVVDEPGVWAASPNPGRMTVANSGWHMAYGVWERTANTSTSTSNNEALRVNDTYNLLARTIYRLTSENRVNALSSVGKLTAGDYFHFQVYSYNATTMGAASNGMRLVELIGPSAQGAEVSSSGGQSLPTATGVAIQFDSEDVDDAGYVDLTTDNTKITIPSGGDGWYVITGMVGIVASSTGGGRRGYININGTQVSRDSCVGALTGTIWRLCPSAVAYLTSGDYIQLIADQNRGSTINSESCKLSAVRIGTSDGAVVRRSTTQSISSATPTAVSFDTEVKNTDGYYSSGSPTRFTVPSGKAGWHVIYGSVHWAGSSSTTNPRTIYLTVNGSYVPAECSRNAPAAHNDPHLSFSVPVYLEAGDYCELVAYSGNTVSLQANKSYFGIARVEDTA